MKSPWNFKDLTNKRFNRLIVLSFFGIKKGRGWWTCKCDCGNIVINPSFTLNNGNTQSCGCLNRELILKSNTKHGLSTTRFHNIWRGMKDRCLNKKSSNSLNYGGRGITVCERWLKFENFRDDMYESYQRHVEEFGEKQTTLDRIDNDGNYEPSNCEWNTYRGQNRNRKDSANSDSYDLHLHWKSYYCSTLNESIRTNRDTENFVKLYGIGLLEFKQYIKALFQPGMIWANHGRSKNGVKCWQIDHIIPCNRFDLSKEEDRKKCFHYTNLQPLWWEDNLAKKTVK